MVSAPGLHEGMVQERTKEVARVGEDRTGMILVDGSPFDVPSGDDACTARIPHQ